MHEKLFLQITVLPHFGLTFRLLPFSLSTALEFVVPAWKLAVGVPQNERQMKGSRHLSLQDLTYIEFQLPKPLRECQFILYIKRIRRQGHTYIQ